MVKVTLFILAAILFFTGCSYSSPYRPTKPNELIQDNYISVRAIDNNWEIDSDYKGSVMPYGFPGLYLHKNNFTFDIVFRTQPYRDGEIYQLLFDKNAQYWDSDKIPEIYDKRDKEQGISYKKGWVAYIQGMKCLGNVFSRSFGGNAYSATSKNYNILCGYYDKQEGKRILEISYRYYGGIGDTKLQGSQDEKNITPKEAEEELKEALKEILQTLHIKCFDKEKMIQEGLYHPERKFKSTKW